MATDTQRDVEMMQRSLRFFQEDMMRAERSSKGLAENITDLGWQIKFGQRNFMEYVGQAIKLPPILKEASLALLPQSERIMASIKGLQDQRRLGEEMLKLTRTQIKELKESGIDVDKLKSLKDEERIYKSLTKETKAGIALEENRLELAQRIKDLTGKRLAVEFLMIKGFRDAIRLSGEMNDALIQANSLTDTRYDLTKQIYQVQAQTGASVQTMLSASKALMTVWPKGRTDFQDVLKTVVQMEEGLGVGFETSSQMARIFQVSLKVPVRDVADQIAIIANNTSLAADEATRFATEIGKALRLLGPGAAPGAREVAGYITLMSARMKDVGGDAGEIIKMFTEMTKGTAQAFMLRGIAGVGSPAALGTQAGAQQAMQGIGRMIDRIVTAAPGTAAYTAQLEAAAQIMGISTESVVLFKNMLKEANKPLDEHAKLQERWQEQIVNANKSLQRIRESFVALYQKALLPLVPALAWTFGIIAKIVSFIASNRITVTLATVAVFFAIIKTVASLALLTRALLQTAAASAVAARYEMLRRPFSAGGIGMETGKGIMPKALSALGWGASFKELGSILTKEHTLTRAGVKGWFSSMMKISEAGRAASVARTATQAGWFARLVGGVGNVGAGIGNVFKFLKGPALLIGLAALVGYGVGTLIDKAMTKLGKWAAVLFPIPYLIKMVSSKLGELTSNWKLSDFLLALVPIYGPLHVMRKLMEKRHEAQIAATLPKAGQRPVWEIMADVRREAIRGHMDQAIKIFEENKDKVAGLRGEKGAKGYLDSFVNTMADVRERIGMTTVTADEKKTLENDRQMIELTKKQVDNSGEYLKKWRDVDQKNNNNRDADRAKAEKERIVQAASFRLTQDQTMPQKTSLVPTGQQMMY